MSSRLSFISAIIGTEIVSLVICMILLMGSTMDGRKSKRTRMFILFVLCDATGCFCDLLSWLMEGHPEFNSVLYVTTLLAMLMTFVLVGVFISYLSAYVSEKEQISNTFLIIGWIFVAIGVSVTVIAQMTGELFTIQKGCFLEKPLYPLYVFINCAYVMIGIPVIIKYKKALDMYDKLASYAYMLMPMASGMIGIWVDGWDFSYTAITISLLIIYIMCSRIEQRSWKRKEWRPAIRQSTMN